MKQPKPTLCPRRRCWLLVALLLALAAPAGGARVPQRKQRPPQAGLTRTQRARGARLAEEGAAALLARDWSRAYQAFAEAYRIDPGPTTLYSLGTVASGEGRSVEAHDLLRRYVQEVPEDAEPDRWKEAQRILGQPLAPPAGQPTGQVPTGEVTVTGEPGAWVLLDERLVGVLPLSLPLLLSAGPHQIRVEKGGGRLAGQIEVKPGRLLRARFQLKSGVVVVTQTPVVIVLHEHRELPKAWQERLTQAVERAVARERAVVLGREAALGKAAGLGSCLETLPCQEELAQKNAAQYVLTVRAAAPGEQGGPWRLGLGLFDAATGDVAGEREKACPSCGPEQAAAALEEALGQLLAEGFSRARGTVAVVSVPTGAEVLLAGRKVGTTPVERAAWAGTQEVVVTLPGHQPHRGTVVIEDGKKATLEVTLQPEGGPDPASKAAAGPAREKERPAGKLQLVGGTEKQPAQVRTRVARPRWRIAAGASAMGLGLLFLGFGVPALAIDGTCTGETSTSAAVVCPSLFNTRALGVGLTVAGAALAAGGAVLAIVPGPLRMVSLSGGIMDRGAALRLAGSF